MIYIVEGVDGVGKTTFINKFSKLTGYEVIKGSSFELAEKGTSDMYIEMLNQLESKENIILDRCFISNLVYAPIYDKDMLSFKQYEKLLKILIKNCKLIHLTAPYSVLYNRFITRGDDQIEKEYLFQITKSYDQTLLKLSSLSSEFRYTQFDTSKYHSELLAKMYYQLEKDQQVKDDLNVIKSYIRFKYNKFNEYLFKLYFKIFK